MTSVLDFAPVIPVVVLQHPPDAVPLAEALVAGVLPVVEITLRTEGAREAIGAVATEVPDAVVGAGTVRTPEQANSAVQVGAQFLVSPGWTDRLLESLQAANRPFLPGVSTTSEALALSERGVREMKFFPAEAAGDGGYLKALASPLPEVRFCPTGGVTQSNAPDYLALPNVSCVGGSWMVPQDALAARDWDRIERLAAAAAGLRP